MSGDSSTQREIITVGESRVGNVYGVPKDARIVLERDVRAEMRDGVNLMTNVFRPEEPGQYPVVLSLWPYGKDAFPSDANYARIHNTGAIRVSEWVPFEAPDPLFWVPSGYVVVAANCRATHNSEGDHFEHFAKQIAEDFHDVVEWAARQPWSNGNVGSNGVSYLAIIQWLGAAENPPHLKAMIPWEGFNDPYREHAFHGGMPETGFFHQIWRRHLDPETGVLRKGATGEDIIAEAAAHPLLDDYWRAKHPDLSKIDVPAYVVTSWSTAGLHTRGTIEGFKQMASADKWLEVHGRKEWEQYYAPESLHRQRRFFDCFLKGEDSGIRELPRVRLEVRDRLYESRFRFADDFPVPGTEYRELYLDAASGSLGPAPAAAAGSVRYSATRADGEPDRAAFSITFDERTELVGHMKLRLWVSAEGADDMDLHVGIRKYDAGGNEVRFLAFQHIEEGPAAFGWLRVSHRELDEARSTPWQPWLRHERLLKLAEGEIVPVEIEILPSGTAFDAGCRLELVVQGYDVMDSPLPRHRHDDTVNSGHHVIHTGGQYDSHLLVPVLPAADSR